VGSGGPGLATSTTGQSGAENTFALSVARLVESLPLSTPPGATSRILPGPIIAGLQLSVPEPDIEGDIELVIDENTFALSMARPL
jgi:hypothetical protein